ncbi:glycine/D-amino acid oxidase-like deaminating enzyme [Roseibium hamelinense]|uniref:Glycine/D-amino acid oxidase-like deaminating enzyme n=1 Tax=Roseibium hamelinense TaxID=150831 RepID=A0A562TAG6_9HYPH|nr:FAD-dependent oxidoreductase [Roseibium hamelinense]MTI45502.1 FAD-binding oxidoreductase [Roseibium hamelinense]TWI90124.1 glycine/D-amino acid oxidase-like deaminating enzyme [Roseibium hamelinense]
MPLPPDTGSLNVGSFWEESVGSIQEDPKLFGEAAFDFAIVGAGFTGLSAAIALTGAGASVCILEAGRVGWGASGRNGGFCCLGGSKLSDRQMVRRYGLDQARAYFDYQCEAIEAVSNRLESYQIEADRHSHGEIYLAHRPSDFAGFAEEARFLDDSYGIKARVLSPGDLRTEGIAGPEFHGGLHVPVGFALNPMKYVQGLARKARARGVRIYARSPATGIEPALDGAWSLKTPEGTVRAGKVILAGNAYAREDTPAWLKGRLFPVMSSILVTRPLTDAELSDQGWTSDLMASDTRTLLHYFRLLPDRRFLFGTRGGLFETQSSLSRMHAAARDDFDRMFPAWRGVETSHAWYGHVCLTRDLVPYVGPVPRMDGVFAAMAWHGSGIAMASLSGEKLAELALGRIGQDSLPQAITAPPRKFPLPALRGAYLQGAYWWYALQDR